MLGLVVDVRVVQHGLGRDTSDVQAGTPEGSSLFDADGLVTELSGLDGGDVSSGSCDFDCRCDSDGEQSRKGEGECQWVYGRLGRR